MATGLSDLLVLFVAAASPFILWWYRSIRTKHVLSATQCESFFEYTSGRWLYNEDKQLALRYIWFNINALQELAANTVGASYCTTMAKTHEGSYNKIFHLKFDNNQELIAKIPTKLIPPFYTTASEVATMDYARNVLKIQAPEVLAYSAHADSTPVGTEFILMRPGSGTELRKRWDLMSEVDAKSVIDQVLNAESQFTKHHFSQIGSIYYKEDVGPSLRKLPLYRDGSGSEPGADRFRIGPSTEWVLWRGARADLEVDRGPWPDVKSYIVAIVRIHQAWLSSCARPYRVQVPPRSAKDLDPQAHKHILDKLVSFFSKVQVPPDLCVNVLWHKDLHARNIMIGNSSPPSIQLIDWQGASVGPLFQQATFAMFAQYHGDSRIELLNGARLPANFDSLPWHERIYLKHQRKLALRHLYYYSGIDPNSQDAQQWSRNVHLRSAIDEAGRTWDLGLQPFRRHLLNLAIVSGAGELADSSLDDYDHTRIQIYQDKVAQLYRELELEGDGWVSKECYDDVYVLNQERQETWDEVVAGGPYPIMNGAPSWFVDS
ncbi:phosphotransferase enzyme family protein [Rhizoctonia solani AG-3 Rhs1AP]|uniref:Altered inheritance of mitochondria protein 9, mitochondrial n=1 Tax=Rhizoctonia solani AG-3 Rhs1AP TaxID=1086054 RepID=X8IZB3_9AGAM|nr:phosphotransferase enzyme family protein [Rhizoctonia solani AG-3 Rhs1AP]